MLGIRTKDNNKFLKFFSKVQEKASSENKVFFLDFGECIDFQFEDMELDILFGGLIPIDNADKFNKEFLGRKINQNWNDYYISVKFKVINSKLDIIFE